LQQRPGVFKMAGTFAFNTRLGIATRKGETSMKQPIDQAMSLFVKSGSYKALLAKYQFPSESSIFV
ncbi:MAG: ABC transporter substrate-binding protein, partial [Vulcanimicrobiaceae bacterium]